MKGNTIRPYCSSSSSAFLRINVAKLAVILILLCHLSGQVVNARVLFARKGMRTSDDEPGKVQEMVEKPYADKYQVGADGNPVNDETQISAFADQISNNELDNYARPPHLRDPRAAPYHRKNDDDHDSRKHVNHIPSLNNSKRVPPPAEDSSDDETFDSLEANREAFLEILKEHAKTPHRRRSFKKHSDKMLLKFDDKIQRWTLTERQSDEWF